MKGMVIIIISVILASININCQKIGTNPESANISESTNENLDVLFIGSSYFYYNNLSELFTNLAENSGKEVNAVSHIAKGYLSDHAGYISTESKINETDWDFIILQGVGTGTAYPEVYTNHPVLPALESLQTKILNNCENTKIVFCMPWAFEDGMTWLAGWTDTYTEMQFKIYENTIKWADSLNIFVAPVGWAWNTVLNEKNFPLHYLHLSDWNHPSLKGSYLMACVIYSTIYQKSCTEIPYYAGLKNDGADYFQEVASDIVLNNLETWNIK